MTELGEYHFKLLHKLGKTHVKPDILSRQPDLDKEEKDNENEILLKEEHFHQMEFIFEDLGDDFVKRIKVSGESKDRVVEKGLLKNDKGYVEEDGIVTWQGCLYGPKNKKLQEDIIKEHHDSHVAGHPGQYKTQELITRNYWWPYIQADIHKYIDGCEMCQRTKTH